MYTPYQCVEVVGEFIIGASAHELHTFSLRDGSQISTWLCPGPPNNSSTACQSEHTNHKEGLQSSNTPLIEVAGSGPNPPAKRRRLSEQSDHEPYPNDGIAKREELSARLRRPASNSSIYPNIVSLTSSKDGKYIVIVTGEDKTIRVFQHEDGQLRQISERSMPKRPCAVTLSASDSAIICADKFGDVYSLPLLVDSSKGQDVTQISQVASDPLSEERKQFVSAANDLTVHSARNRKALQNQLKQKLTKTDKVGTNVGQQLLLGHVSMLTDILLVEECGRDYIITADRDEHIRISRGIPQSHIIETYCLGHSEFVSRLCLTKSSPRVLVSGGGDDDLFVWDWHSGNLIQKVNISSHIEGIVPCEPLSKQQGVSIKANDDLHPRKVVVSGIKHVLHGPGFGSGCIVIMCEGVPALFIFALSPMGILSHYQTFQLQGNPLAVATDRSCNTLIVSIDLVHCPGSVNQLRDQETPGVQSLQVIQFENTEWKLSNFNFKGSHTADIGNQALPFGNDDRWSILYSLGNMRKRAGGE